MGDPESLQQCIEGRRFSNPVYVDADDAGPQVSGDEPTEVFAPLMNAHKAAKHNGGAAALLGTVTAVTDDNSSSAMLAPRLPAGVRVTRARSG
ncbi:hypothetical protein [Spirillospora sp. CA-128828]|uniref:hypothetical protein n=1 Tax=Spirillospora sp. CA-128828 TaxID=3240033 RepID=UPI003D8E8A09